MVGSDNNLVVAVGSYRPSQVECRGQFKPYKSCREILIDMPVTSDQEIFGPADDPQADVMLPQGVISGKE